MWNYYRDVEMGMQRLPKRARLPHGLPLDVLIEAVIFAPVWKKKLNEKETDDKMEVNEQSYCESTKKKEKRPEYTPYRCRCSACKD